MIQIVTAFERELPGWEAVLIDTGLTRPLLEWLRSREVDMLAARLPLDQPDLTIGPVLSREPRVLVVARHDPLAACESVTLEDFAERAVTDNSSVPRETMDAFCPPRTHSGRTFRRVQVTSLAEAIMRAASGAIVHPTVSSFIDHVSHPGVVAIPISDLPPSETALIWLTANHSPAVHAFSQTAANILATTELAALRRSTGATSTRPSPAPTAADMAFD